MKPGTFRNIPAKVLKDSSDIGHSILRDTWKYKIFGKQYFPKNLKLTDITPVNKKKDPTLVENYRPVRELPCVSKVFERIVQKQISSSIGKFIFPYLCGYRNGFNTQHAFLSLIEKWKKTLDGKGYTAAVLMELLKAFDTINYDFLNAKLYAKRFFKGILKLIFLICTTTRGCYRDLF